MNCILRYYIRLDYTHRLYKVREEGGEEGEEDEEEEDSQASDMDPYDMLDPVEILSKLPKNFYEQVISGSGSDFKRRSQIGRIWKN